MITMKDVIREGNPLLKEKSVEVKIPLSTTKKYEIEFMCN